MGKSPTVAKAMTIAATADLAGVTEAAVRMAITRGVLAVHPTACGRARLIDQADAKAWAAREHKVGRPRKVQP